MRGDYARIAGVLAGTVRDHPASLAPLREACLRLADVFGQRSTTFVRARFLTACGVEDRPAPLAATVVPTPAAPDVGWIPRVGDRVRLRESLNGGNPMAGTELTVRTLVARSGAAPEPERATIYSIDFVLPSGRHAGGPWAWEPSIVRRFLEPIGPPVTFDPAPLDPATLATGTAVVTRAPFPSQNAAGIVQQVAAGVQLTVETCAADGPRFVLAFRELPQAHGNLYRWPAATVGRLLARVSAAPVDDADQTF